MKIHTSGEEYEIADNRIGFGIIERKISDFLINTSEKELTLNANTNYDPYPYNRKLNGLIIQKADGPTLVKEKQGYLFASGGIGYLDAFSSYFGFDENATKGSHHHFDYLPGNDFVHPDTLDLVVSLETNTEPADSGNG